MITPTDAIEACLARISERDPSVHAFLFVAHESARAEAHAQTVALQNGERLGSLAGIPIAVKDLEDVRGMPTTFGLKTSSSSPASHDSVQVARLRRAGAIVVGKTNTPADGFAAVTKNLLGPPSKNPWALDRSPGGSSGGSAAAVAGGMVPWATSSDGGGSIRIPASLTGCFGLKPTRGLIPQQIPVDGIAPWLRHAVVGPTTRCVRDAAIYLDTTVGYDSRDPDSAVNFNHGVGTQYEDAVLEALDAKYPSGVLPSRIGFLDCLVSGLASQPDVTSQVKGCMLRVRQLIREAFGNKIELVELEQGDISIPHFGKEWTDAVGAYRLARFTKAGLTQPEQAAQIDKGITAAWPRIRDAFTLEAQGNVFAKIAACNEQLARIFERCDILITSSLGMEAYPANGPPNFVALGETSPRIDETDPFQVMMPLNYSGHPGAVVRAGFSESGLPCAVQIIGERGREDQILSIAALYESKYGCFQAWPSWPFAEVASKSRL